MPQGTRYAPVLLDNMMVRSRPQFAGRLFALSGNDITYPSLGRCACENGFRKIFFKPIKATDKVFSDGLFQHNRRQWRTFGLFKGGGLAQGGGAREEFAEIFFSHCA